MTDHARKVAFDPRAPADERYEAQAELQKAAMPRALSDLIPASNIQPIIDYINRDLEDQAMNKALGHAKVIPFPSNAVKDKKPGMQSVWLDDLQININGDWFERPGQFSFDAMKAMVDQTPILNAVIMTRQRQVARFCRPQKGGKGPGFKISSKENFENVDESEQAAMKLLESFISNSGWEAKPRQRMRLKRDNFQNFIMKLTRDSLTMDSMAIETEWKRDKALGLDGLYAVDGSTIRLCSEDGYRGEDEIFALQVVQGQIRAAYGYDDLIYVPRNPRTDVLAGGYGLAETELLVRVVTGFLNAFTYNTKFFDSNAIPKGMLNMYGNFSDEDIAAFRRQWNAMVKGVNNAWAMPVMVSKDTESKADFTEFGNQANEIMFAKWMSFLSSIICAIYGISPEEINFESFTSGTSSLSGDDTEEKIVNSKDKGLRPLLSYFESTISEYVISEFSDKYAFEWTGLDEEDEKQVWERKKMTRTVNEIRAEDGVEKADGKWGDAPLNPSLVGAWQQEAMPQQEDYGQPGAQPDQGDPSGDGAQDFGGAQQGGDPQGDQDFGQPEQGGDDQPQPASDPQDLAKSFGLPVFRIQA
jgi:hypothetical protein